jgi:hypothetical protein
MDGHTPTKMVEEEEDLLLSDVDLSDEEVRGG